MRVVNRWRQGAVLSTGGRRKRDGRSFYESYKQMATGRGNWKPLSGRGPSTPVYPASGLGDGIYGGETGHWTVSKK